MAKLWAHVHDPPPAVGVLDPGLEQFQPVIDRAMAKEPDDRFQSAGDFGRAAAAIAAGHTPSQAEQSVARGSAAPARGQTTVPAVEHASPPHAVSGRRPIVAGSAIATLAALAVVAVLLAGGGNNGGGSGRKAGPAVAAATVTPFSVPSPNAVAPVSSGVWVSSSAENAVHRISSSGKVSRPIKAGKGPGPLAAGDGEVWVVNRGDRSVMRIDADTGAVRGKPVSLRSTSEFADSILLTPTVVWVVSTLQGRLVRIDRKSLASRIVAPPDGTAGEIAVADGRLWVMGDHARLAELDAVTGKQQGEVPVGKAPAEVGQLRAELAAGLDAVWIALLDEEQVVRVEPATRRIVARIKVPQGIDGDLTVGSDAVFVINSAGKPVRIDPKTNKVDAVLPAPPAGAADMTFSSGALWIASPEKNDKVTRIKP
jgi:hypothetical protein